MGSSGTDCGVVDLIENEETDEEPLAKRLRLSFDVDSDAENSDYPPPFHAVNCTLTRLHITLASIFNFKRTKSLTIVSLS